MEILRSGVNNILELLRFYQPGDIRRSSSPSMEQSEDNGASLPVYHPAKSLPFELVQHTAIFFEEKLYTQALTLLLNILTSHPDASLPTFIPSPHHLALAATFLVHPSTTARPKTPEEEEAPNVSLRLLRLVNTLVGPVSARFDSAFSFTHFESSRHGRRRHAADDTRSAPKNPAVNGEKKLLNLDRHIDLDLAQFASVWCRAEDFWHAVGWAFNCAVLHPLRWERWRIWLEFMCEVLEDDWNERKRLQDEDPSHDPRILQDSLIMQYISRSSGGYAQNRRILRAIFADGGPTAVNEFREVFHHELKKSRKKPDDPSSTANSNLKKREMEVNIDEDQYGDYLTDGNSSTSSSSARNKPGPKRPRRAATRGTARTRAQKSTAPTSDPDPDSLDSKNINFTPSAAAATGSLLGDMTSLALRQRLLHLLSIASQSLGKHSFISLEDLYHLFVENIRPLPLPIFQAFVSPFALPHFSPEARTTLCEYLLFRTRESAAPATDEEYLTQTKLELCFLPYAAATPNIVENAKMSIALEALIMLLDESDLLRITPELQDAAKRGILRRAERAQEEKRKTQIAKKSEHLEWSWLIESGERLMFLIEEVIPLRKGRVA